MSRRQPALLQHSNEVFLNPDRDQLVEQHIEFNKIRANIIALRAKVEVAKDDSDMSDNLDDDTPSPRMPCSETPQTSTWLTRTQIFISQC